MSDHADFKDREIQTLAAFTRSMKSKLSTSDIDMKKFRELTGYKSDGSARNALHYVFKKIFADKVSDDDGDVAAATPKVASKKPRTKKTTSDMPVGVAEEISLDVPGGYINLPEPTTPNAVKSAKKRSADVAADGEGPAKKARALKKPALNDDGNQIPPKSDKKNADKKHETIDDAEEDNAAAGVDASAEISQSAGNSKDKAVNESSEQSS